MEGKWKPEGKNEPTKCWRGLWPPAHVELNGETAGWVTSCLCRPTTVRPVSWGKKCGWGQPVKTGWTLDLSGGGWNSLPVPHRWFESKFSREESNRRWPQASDKRSKLFALSPHPIHQGDRCRSPTVEWERDWPQMPLGPLHKEPFWPQMAGENEGRWGWQSRPVHSLTRSFVLSTGGSGEHTCGPIPPRLNVWPQIAHRSDLKTREKWPQGKLSRKISSLYAILHRFEDANQPLSPTGDSSNTL